MNTIEWWTMLSAIGTIGAAIVALGLGLYPIIKENWRRLWIKIYSAEITLASIGPYTPIGSDTVIDLSDDRVILSAPCLILGITNKTNIDIGIKVAYAEIYIKNKQTQDNRFRRLKLAYTEIKKTQNGLFHCLKLAYIKVYRIKPIIIRFGKDEEHPKEFIKKLESNPYFLYYDSEIFQSIGGKNIENIDDTKRIKITLKTTVGEYTFNIPKKNLSDAIAGISKLTFPKYKPEIKMQRR